MQYNSGCRYSAVEIRVQVLQVQVRRVQVHCSTRGCMHCAVQVGLQVQCSACSYNAVHECTCTLNCTAPPRPCPPPSLQSDRLLKFKVINDTLNIVTPLEWLSLTEEAALPAGMRSTAAYRWGGRGHCLQACAQQRPTGWGGRAQGRGPIRVCWLTGNAVYTLGRGRVPYPMRRVYMAPGLGFTGC